MGTSFQAPLVTRRERETRPRPRRPPGREAETSSSPTMTAWAPPGPSWVLLLTPTETDERADGRYPPVRVTMTSTMESGRATKAITSPISSIWTIYRLPPGVPYLSQRAPVGEPRRRLRSSGPRPWSKPGDPRGLVSAWETCSRGACLRGPRTPLDPRRRTREKEESGVHGLVGRQGATPRVKGAPLGSFPSSDTSEAEVSPRMRRSNASAGLTLESRFISRRTGQAWPFLSVCFRLLKICLSFFFLLFWI